MVPGRKPRDPAPSVTLPLHDGTRVALADLWAQHVVVLFFYPKDNTAVCTKEACAFRDAWKRYEQANVAIIGVSNDTTKSHEKFQREEHLPFPLAADESGAIAAAYGVKKNLWGYDRVSFLIDREGKVAHVWPSVDPGVHADEVLAEATKTN